MTEFVETLSLEEETLIVGDDGEPRAALIPVEDLRFIQRERAWIAIREMQERNADAHPEDVMRFVSEAVAEVRGEKRNAVGTIRDTPDRR